MGDRREEDQRELQPATHRDALCLFEDRWSEPVEQSLTRTLDFHAARLCRWLLRAGAEPRFTIILSSGAFARGHLEARLEAAGISASLHRSTDERPIPRALLEHHGDHFNRKIYFLDLSGEEAVEEIAERLRGRLKQLRRPATWVGLIVESPALLSALWSLASDIPLGAQRRALLLDPRDLSLHSPAPAVQPLPREAPPADQLFESWATPTRAPSAGEYGRLLRAGYGEPAATKTTHPTWRRYRGFHLYRPLDALLIEALTGEEVEAVGRHRRALIDALPPHQQATLKQRWLDPLTRADGPLASTSVEARRASIWLRECALGESTGQESRLRKAVATLAEAPSALQIGYLWAAEAAARLGASGFELCLEFLLELWSQQRAPFELRFASGRRALELLVVLHRRQEAKRLCESLEEMGEALHSPLYVAEALEARASLASALDEGRAQVLSEEARALKERHGL
ncbi:MAG: hypothetical protein VYD19_03300 [Myxococcota bacterium]|nr:hypothetical protein [Myxococcota bacterium]